MFDFSLNFYNSVKKKVISVYVQFNQNPTASRVGDCAIRAVSRALNQSWEETYIDLSLVGLLMGDLPSANTVWGAYLRKNGFKRALIPTEDYENYTVSDFAKDNKKGTFILALNGHVVAVVDGDYYDSWDSGDEVPIYYWYKEK